MAYQPPSPAQSIAVLPRAPVNGSPVPGLTSLYHKSWAGPYGSRAYTRTRFEPGDWGRGHLVHTPERRWRAAFSVALRTFPAHRVVCVDRHQ